MSSESSPIRFAVCALALAAAAPGCHDMTDGGPSCDRGVSFTGSWDVELRFENSVPPYSLGQHWTLEQQGCDVVASDDACLTADACGGCWGFLPYGGVRGVVFDGGSQYSARWSTNDTSCQCAFELDLQTTADGFSGSLHHTRWSSGQGTCAGVLTSLPVTGRRPAERFATY